MLKRAHYAQQNAHNLLNHFDGFVSVDNVFNWNYVTDRANTEQKRETVSVCGTTGRKKTLLEIIIFAIALSNRVCNSIIISYFIVIAITICMV